jgi:hypothetical protein
MLKVGGAMRCDRSHGDIELAIVKTYVSGIPEFEEIKEIIRGVAQEFDGLRREASYALEVERNPDRYRALLRERAQLVTAMPKLLSVPLKSVANKSLQAALTERVEACAAEASDALKSGDILRLVVLLGVRRVKGPNKILSILELFRIQEETLPAKLLA